MKSFNHLTVVLMIINVPRLCNGTGDHGERG